MYIKLETVSIAQPLQKRHYAQTPYLWANFDMQQWVYVYRLNFIWINILCRPCGEKLPKCRNCDQIFTLGGALVSFPFYQSGPNLVANSRPTVYAYTPKFI